MAISNQISRLTTLRNSIRTKLIGLGILPAASTSATLSECYSVLSNVTGLGASSYTPTTTSQVIASGQYLSGAQTINAIPSAYIIPSGTSNITANNVYDITQYASVSVNVQPALQSKTVTPTTAVQSVTPDTGVYGLSKVTVNAIPAAYIIPSGTITLSSSGIFDVGSYASADVTVTGGPNSFYAVAISHSVGGVGGLSNGTGLYCYNCSKLNYVYASMFGYKALLSFSTFSYISYIYSNGFDHVDFSPLGISSLELTSIIGSKALGDSGFYHATLPSEVHVPNVVTLSSVDSCFAYASGAKSYYFDNLEIIYCGYLFDNNKMEYFYAPKLYRCSQTGTFRNCVNLKSITINSSFEYVGQSMFEGCVALQSIDIFKTKSLPANAFLKCTALTNISASMLESIPGGSVFASCNSLSSVYFPELSLISGIYAFWSCIALKNVSFPKLQGIRGSGYAFGRCSSLNSVYFPELTTLSATSGNVFISCIALTTISFPKIVNISGSSNFTNCYNLISLFFLGSSVCALGRTIAQMFASTPVSTYSTSAGRWASIFVPSSLLASYKAATNWTTISSKIFAYESYFDSNGNPL